MRKLSLLLLVPLLTLAAALPAQAQDRDHHDNHRPGYRYERDHHDEGRWYHGRHAGRVGWWWVVGDSWRLHPAPVYPMPPRRGDASAPHLCAARADVSGSGAPEL